ncbi:MAG: DEAD/DEAH box helicase family protein [Verrucomicrobia bacterium]|nr:DEAD/DEAH box helicase family protein [Verrucomicrobiota bacterium]
MRERLLASIFSKNGLLGRTLPDFEERPGQKEMAAEIIAAYEEKKTALIEAGTGTGKSLAYLVPAVLWALKHQEKTVISTHTIALQEQLLLKDIPFLVETLDVEIQASLVKGMRNYLCLRKLDELSTQPLLFSTEETQEIQAIELWAERAKEGSRSEISFPLSPGTWEKVAVDAESCSNVQCPHYKRCFFFKARKEAADAQILIINHHLLLADVNARRKNPGAEAILPSYDRLIIDEAHTLESVALDSFAAQVDRLFLLRKLAALHSDAHPERSRLFLLRKELSLLPQIPPDLIQKLDTDLPATKRDCQKHLEEAFNHLTTFFETVAKDPKLRITPALVTHPTWQATLVPQLQTLSQEFSRLGTGIQGLLYDLEIYKNAPIQEKLAPHLLELGALLRSFTDASTFFENFIQEKGEEKRVRYLEMTSANLTLVDAALDISSLLHENLFDRLATTVLCSATITAAQSFTHLKQRLGIRRPAESLQESIFDSPFDYPSRTLFLVPSDLPAPNSPDFLAESIRVMAEAIAISKGSTFLLFTSYDMLQNCYRALSALPIATKYPFLRQGDLPRHLLLEKFKRSEGNVLFGTDSFWEGVDVPGEALRSVIIAKLPFSVPTDPLTEAYTEALAKEGLDPFFDYSVPQAIIKFKQGFGRLMRKKEDRGCVLCLDQRLVKKGYGKLFMKSLPPSKTCLAPAEEVLTAMRGFYTNIPL